jgi:transposase
MRMARLDPEARVAIRTLVSRGTSNSAIARLLDVTEGAVRYQVARMSSGRIDGRSAKLPKANCVAAAIDFWREGEGAGPVNLAALHDWLAREHGYGGSLRSVQRFWTKRYPAPAIRARRRVETPPGAQAQVDWAHFKAMTVGGAARDLVAFKMVLSHSRREAIVWSESKAMLAWLGCHTAAFRRLGGVPATVRIDNERTGIAQGAGAWGVIHPSYRRYATMLRFHVDACPPRQPRYKGKVERRVRDQRFALNPRSRAWSDIEELQRWTDDQLVERSARLICPASGRTVSETFAAEREKLTPLPETLPEPFDIVVLRSVGLDALVAFEGRQYSVPFRHVGERVEVRGCAATVQILKDCRIVATHPRGTMERLVIQPDHYEGPNTPRVIAPPPLGRMGAKMMELATHAVAHRSIDFYAALADVAR